ncbi:MAG: PorP/SprF family type IX secretion system membrane protein [Saprospiraceae bacterium]|nr:PorP/SprF family type IX secretion system membrane protein [Saprospiraceae bacterium]
MRQLIIAFLLLVGNTCVKAQQRPQFTQYMLNKYYENPAYAGLERSLSIFTSYRDQYSLLLGNPRTFYLGVDMPFYLWNGALGFAIYNQKSGILSNTNIKVSYNYVTGTSYGFFSFGGRLGMDFMNIDGNAIITPDGSYEGVFDHNDPFLEVVKFSGAGLSWELGAFFMGKDIQAGINLIDLPSHSFKFGNSTFNKSFVGNSYFQYRYFLNEELELIPSFMIKTDISVTQIDLGILGRYRDNLFGGVNFRGYNSTSIDALSFIIGTNMGKKYKISYSYDFGLSDLSDVNQGTHEIMLSYNLQKLIGIGLPPKIIYNPRDL